MNFATPAQVGEVLNASIAMDDSDIAITYQWQTSSDGQNWSDIADATGATYTAQPSDLENALRVVVTGTDDDGGGTATATSGLTVVHALAVAALQEISGGGTWTDSGGDYTLDLGFVPTGTSPIAIVVGAANVAGAPADALDGTFSAAASGDFTVSGFAGLSGLAAGASAIAGTVTLDSDTPGIFSEAITFAPSSVAAGFGLALVPETLTITATVADGWTNAVGGNWTNAADWTDGVPDAGIVAVHRRRWHLHR